MSLYLVTIELTPQQIALFHFTSETVRIDSAHASDLVRDMLSAAPQSIQIVPFDQGGEGDMKCAEVQWPF